MLLSAGLRRYCWSAFACCRAWRSGANTGVLPPQRYAQAATKGDGRIVNGILGEAIGLIRDIAPAGKILQGMVNEAEAILRNRPSAWLSE